MCVCLLLKVEKDGESVIWNIWTCAVLMNWNDLFSSYRSDTVQYQRCQSFIKHFLWELSGSDTCTHTHRNSPLEPTDASSCFYIDSCVNEKAYNAHIEACSADMCMSDEAGQRWCCDWSRRRSLMEEKVYDSSTNRHLHLSYTLTYTQQCWDSFTDELYLYRLKAGHQTAMMTFLHPHRLY